MKNREIYIAGLFILLILFAVQNFESKQTTPQTNKEVDVGCVLSQCDCNCYQINETPTEFYGRNCSRDCRKEGILGCKYTDNKCIQVKIKNTTTTTKPKINKTINAPKPLEIPNCTGNFGTVYYALNKGNNSMILSGCNNNTLDSDYGNAGNGLDLCWISPKGENAYVIWDMGAPVNSIKVYMVSGSNQYRVYAAKKQTGPWKESTSAHEYNNSYGNHTNIAIYTLPGYYRYVKITSRADNTDIHRIDALEECFGAGGGYGGGKTKYVDAIPSLGMTGGCGCDSDGGCTTTTTTTTTSTTTTIPNNDLCGNLKVYKYNDTNGNGIWEDGENMLSDFNFTATGPIEFNLTTNKYGESFKYCIPLGTYTITEGEAFAWINTTSNPQNITLVNESLMEIGFGNRQTTTTTTTTQGTTTTTYTTTTTQGTTTTTQGTTTTIPTTTTTQGTTTTHGTTTTTTVPTTTTTSSTTTTTIPNAAEFESISILLAIILTTPAFAYLTIRKKR